MRTARRGRGVALFALTLLGPALLAPALLAGCDRVAGPAQPRELGAPVARRVLGHMLLEDVPTTPAELDERLLPYRNMRSARFVDWLPRAAGMLVSTRFGDSTQLHMVATPGGARDQLTFFRDPVRDGSVRPVGGTPFGFVYRRDNGGAENYQLFFEDWQTLQTRRLTDGGGRSTGIQWANAGDRYAFASTRRNGRDQDIYIGHVDAGRTDAPPRLVLQREGTWSVLDWSPDDARLLVRREVSIGEAYLYALEPASGQLQLLWPAAGTRASVGLARFSPDGSGVYLTSDADAAFEQLLYVDALGHGSRVVSSGIPWDIEAFDVSRVGGVYAFVANEDGVSRLYIRQARRDTPVGVPPLPVGVIGDVRFSPEGDRLAFTLSTPRAPSDVMSIDVATGRLLRWTSSEVGGLDRTRFVGAERVRLRSFDRETFSAFVYRPAPNLHPGRRPVLIEVHGGPEAQARPTFDALREFLVNSLGIVVIEPNVRGSTGYGKRFRDLDNGMHREDALRDIGALLGWVRAQPGLDASRVAISGGSYGGYMALASVARFGPELRAGVSMSGITNLVSFLGSTAPYRQALRRAEYGDERDPVMRAFLDGASPVTQVRKIERPIFVAQGANDPRVPRSEGEQMVRSLRVREVPVWYMLANDEGHGFRQRDNRDLFDATKVLFLQRYLLGAEVRTPAPAAARVRSKTLAHPPPR